MPNSISKEVVLEKIKDIEVKEEGLMVMVLGGLLGFPTLSLKDGFEANTIADDFSLFNLPRLPDLTEQDLISAELEPALLLTYNAAISILNKHLIQPLIDDLSDFN
jgi:hypothetical protein